MDSSENWHFKHRISTLRKFLWDRQEDCIKGKAKWVTTNVLAYKQFQEFEEAYEDGIELLDEILDSLESL